MTKLAKRGKPIEPIKRLFSWLVQMSPRWTHLRGIPFRQFSVFLAGVFLLFTVIGFYNDLMEAGRLPYIVALAFAIISGLNATLWVFIAARAPLYLTLVMIVLQFFLSDISVAVRKWIEATWHPPAVESQAGLHFAATSILIAIIASYSLLMRFMAITGRETMRVKSELALAHGIQKTLVPKINISTQLFEIFGISEPSDKVGGDLVDAVELCDGNVVAYLADIAGHGLQAGILMGMLKTAARTVLTDRSECDGGSMLSRLMDRLNQVLPQVKEAHMYATFTTLWLDREGNAFYGTAASPPILHWIAEKKTIECVDEEQFPLGLLPVSEFPAYHMPMANGDLIVIATDGILEVSSTAKARLGVEFGVESLKKLIEDGAQLPLPELAGRILKSVRKYGKQLDDQTLLLVRRRHD
jgi:serine phosphatase RsbU (regulator of sigma subunit)